MDYSITVSNNLKCFGGSPSNKWGDYDWGAFLWGEGTAVMLRAATKPIVNTQAIASETSKKPTRKFSNTIEPNSDMTELVIKDGSGYSYVFPDNTTDGDDQYTPDWSVLDDPSSGWAETALPSDDWSES